jgi:hypothetical protein
MKMSRPFFIFSAGMKKSGRPPTCLFHAHL